MSSPLVINIKHMKKCAICKYWYDPTNSAITPKIPRQNIWIINDPSQKALCMKRNYNTTANAFCSRDFELKLQCM